MEAPATKYLCGVFVCKAFWSPLPGGGGGRQPHERGPWAERALGSNRDFDSDWRCLLASPFLTPGVNFPRNKLRGCVQAILALPPLAKRLENFSKDAEAGRQ